MSVSSMGLAVSAAVTAMLVTGSAGAADLLTTHRMSAAVANEIVGAAVAACAGQGYAVTAVVIDPDGVRQAQLRGDGAGVHTVGAAEDKAFTAVSTKTDTGVLVERAKTTPPSAVVMKEPRMVLAQGAIVVKVGDEVIGAIGVSGAPGGEKDEACARAALDKVQPGLK